MSCNVCYTFNVLNSIIHISPHAWYFADNRYLVSYNMKNITKIIGIIIKTKLTDKVILFIVTKQLRNICLASILLLKISRLIST